MRAFVSVASNDVKPLLQRSILDSKHLKTIWTVSEIERYFIADEVSSEEVGCGPETCQLGDYSEVHPAFSGSLVYRTDFMHEPTSDRAILDLGVVYYSAEVFLNGQSCGRRGWGPFYFDISSQLRAGLNSLEVRVTNTLANQWAQLENRENQANFELNLYTSKTAEFVCDSLHAGLVGPVSVHTVRDA